VNTPKTTAIHIRIKRSDLLRLTTELKAHNPTANGSNSIQIETNGLNFSTCLMQGICQNQLLDRFTLQTLQTQNIVSPSQTISVSVELQEGHFSLVFILIAF